MQKGESVISVALGLVILFTVLGIQRRWRPSNLTALASSTEDFILNAAGKQGQAPEIKGYERIKTYRLDRYQGGLYRVISSPLDFAPAQFVIYDRANQPVFKLDVLESAKTPWTALYNFRGQGGLSTSGSRSRPLYQRDLTGDGQSDIVIGQYSGGDHCCTTITAVALCQDSVRTLGRVEGLRGYPFEGLEFKKLDRDPDWKIIAHRRYTTACGPSEGDPDVPAVYAYSNGAFADRTPSHAEYLEGVLHEDLGKWVADKIRSLQLLETVALDYALLGRRGESERFLSTNLTPFLPELKVQGVDPKACVASLESLADGVAGSVTRGASGGAR